MPEHTPRSTAAGFDKVRSEEALALGLELPAPPTPAEPAPAPPPASGLRPKEIELPPPDLADALAEAIPGLKPSPAIEPDRWTRPAHPDFRRRPAPSSTERIPPAAPAVEPPTVPRSIGLALSGGGIRSATFSLGVLQALAAQDKLVGVDFLSTVSGGGYIGSWLTAWIHRTYPLGGVAHVQAQLKASVEHDAAAVGAGTAKTRSGSAAPNAPAAPLVEPLEIAWLRKYSNYLAPRVGMLSVDSLTLVMTWLRNTALNLVIVVSLLLAAFLLVHLTAYIDEDRWRASQRYLGYVAALAGAGLLVFFAFNLSALVASVATTNAWLAGKRVRVVVTSLGLLAIVSGGLWFFAGDIDVVGSYAVALAALGVCTLAWAVWLVRSRKSGPWYRRLPWNNLWQYALGGAAALATSFGLLWLVKWKSPPDPSLPAAVTYGPALFLVAFGICGSVYIGISGRAYFERSREWWSRMNAVLVGAGMIWLALFWVGLYIRPTVDWAILHAPGWMTALTTGWLASLIAILKGNLPVKASAATRRYADLLLAALTAVAVAGFVVLVALLADYIFLEAARLAPAELTLRESLAGHLAVRNWQYRQLTGDPYFAFAWRALAALAVVVLVFALFAWRIDINKFSLHNMYKNRLVRCYLGASTGPARKAQPFTGFDENDDIPLAHLRVFQRPRHIVNTALNLSQGRNLAWQERKSASFVFSAGWCGFGLAATQGDSTYRYLDGRDEMPDGYARTYRYASRPPAPLPPRDETAYRKIMARWSRRRGAPGEDSCLTLGSAMATSGAAVSSNMGYRTSPMRAFMVTLFNARLGRWCPNPARKPKLPLSPSLGIRWYLQELFGGTDEESAYVYLSDGGHFENLGLYELVRRRCSVIVVVDASADPERTFQDLGLAVRLCRVDFGAEIDLDVAGLRARGRTRAAAAFAWGTVTYNPNARPPERGVILYIKPTLTADAAEPMDVQAYASRNPTFPHQSTGDQFFDESQFEAYRRLGLHIGGAAFTSRNAMHLPATVPSPAGAATGGA